MQSEGSIDVLSGVNKRIITFLIDNTINDTWMETLETNMTKCEAFNSFMTDANFGRFKAKGVFGSDVQERLEKRLNLGDTQRTLISGSTAEGLSLPHAYKAGTFKIDSSDVDTLFIIGNFTVTDYPTRDQSGTFFFNTTETFPGYVRLEYEERYSNLKSVMRHTDVVRLAKVRTSEGEPVYFLQSGSIVKDYIVDTIGERNEEGILHGPAFTTAEARRTTGQILTESSWDRVPAISCPDWPKQAIEWITRKRNGWPSVGTIVQICKRECFVVPVAHPQSTFKEVEWRLSFTVAEQLLAKSLPKCVRKSFMMFKLLCKHELADVEFLSTYYLKTTLFWACERAPHLCKDTCNELLAAFVHLLETLITFLSKHNLPNYFIPDNNMLSHVGRDFVRDALRKLVHIRCQILPVIRRYYTLNRLDSLPLTFGFDWIYQSILHHDSMTNEELESALLDCLVRLSTAFFLEGREFMAVDLIKTKSMWPVVIWEDSAKIAQKFVTDYVGGANELLNNKISTLENLRTMFLDTKMDNVTVLRKLGLLYFCKSEHTGDRDEKTKTAKMAENMLQQCQLMVTEDVEGYNFHRFLSLLYLGIVLFKMGRFQDAVKTMQKVLELMDKSLDEAESVFFYQSDSVALPDGHAKVLEASEVVVISAKCLALCELAIAHWRLGNTKEAEEACGKLSTYCETTESPPNSSFFLLGSVYEEFGQINKACQAYLADCRIEAQRQTVAIFPDNGLVYKMCVLGNLAFLRENASLHHS
ncbi:uncharacterized protein LOC106157175 [Lingula anatina]|uniref:Uncharacterized protein LOC106157175 n=1 Tax=Lingula anatina TaxID=7574 RepID=A0A1S3HQ26_LINAN|nr:uncharacterized protein LOC106157175 [Lingula anatina]|eukprot:XP_013388158.1 uncharacterized protein LOC106157175 [Lingula anatina]